MENNVYKTMRQEMLNNTQTQSVIRSLPSRGSEISIWIKQRQSLPTVQKRLSLHLPITHSIERSCFKTVVKDTQDSTDSFTLSAKSYLSVSLKASELDWAWLSFKMVVFSSAFGIKTTLSLVLLPSFSKCVIDICIFQGHLKQWPKQSPLPTLGKLTVLVWAVF